MAYFIGRYTFKNERSGKMQKERYVPEEREEIWVKNLCDIIKENKKFLNWSNKRGKSYIILNNFPLPHAINLNKAMKKNDGKNKGIKKDYYIDESLISDISYWNVDIIIAELKNGDVVTPKLVIEAKYKEINTHDPITYSKKASLHKNLFKGLRYGILVGNYKYIKNEKQRSDDQCYIPVRVLDNGTNFDFMYFMKDNYDDKEIDNLIDIIIENIEIADKLEEYKPEIRKDLCIKKNIEFVKYNE